MTHSTVVMDGHGKPQEEQLNYWEYETSDDEFHHFTQSSRPYYGRWVHASAITCQAFGTDCKDLVSMIQDSGAWSNFSTELDEL